MSVILDIPMPPSVNQMYRNVSGKGRVKTKKYLDWIVDCEFTFHEQKKRNEPVPGNFNCEIVLSEESRRPNADCDNRIKAVLDLLQAWNLITDDCLADKVIVRWGSAPKGMCKVYVWKVAGK